MAAVSFSNLHPDLRLGLLLVVAAVFLEAGFSGTLWAATASDRLDLGPSALRVALRRRQPGSPLRSSSGHPGGLPSTTWNDGGRSRDPGHRSRPSDSLGQLRVGRCRNVHSRSRGSCRRLPHFLCGRREGIPTVQGGVDRRPGPGVQRELGRRGDQRLGDRPAHRVVVRDRNRITLDQRAFWGAIGNAVACGIIATAAWLS